MEYAIIETGGKQYKASIGKTLEIEKLQVSTGVIHTFENVLLYSTGEICKIGQPVLKNVVVTGKVIDQIKAPKIRVAKFKAKARFRKVQGHRQRLTKIKIDKIIISDQKVEPGSPEVKNKKPLTKPNKTKA
jgi:large subunit ribosomal protein L21